MFKDDDSLFKQPNYFEYECLDLKQDNTAASNHVPYKSKLLNKSYSMKNKISFDGTYTNQLRMKQAQFSQYMQPKPNENTSDSFIKVSDDANSFKKQVSNLQHQVNSRLYSPPAVRNFHETTNTLEKAYTIPDNYNFKTTIHQPTPKNPFAPITSSLKGSSSLMHESDENLAANVCGTYFHHQDLSKYLEQVQSNNKNNSTPNVHSAVSRGFGHQDQKKQMVSTNPMGKFTARQVNRNLTNAEIDKLFDMQVCGKSYLFNYKICLSVTIRRSEFNHKTLIHSFTYLHSFFTT